MRKTRGYSGTLKSVSFGQSGFGKGIVGPLIVLFALLLLSAAITYFLDRQPDAASGGNSIKKFASYEELANYVMDSGEAYGYYSGGISRQAAADAALGTAPATAKSASESAGGASGYSATNIQVEGVDEADIVKNDGKYIYAVSGNKVVIVDAYPAESAKKASEISFNGTVNEIFVNGNTLVVFGQKIESAPAPVPLNGVAEKMVARPDIYPIYSPKATVAIYDVSDKTSPLLAGEISIDGNYYNSRMVGKYVYVIASKQAYYAYAGEKNVTVPSIYYRGQLISQAFPDIYYFDGVPGNTFTTIAAINLDNPSDVASKVLLTNYAQNMFVSEKNIYIIYSRWVSEADYIGRMVDIIKPLVPPEVQGKIDGVMALDISNQTKMQAIGEILGKYSATLGQSERDALQAQAGEKMQELQEQIAREREKTIVQKISIDGGSIEYKVNGEVPGNALNQFSMDEHNGYFRIATTTSGNGGFVAMGGVSTPPVMQPAAQKALAAEKAQVSQGAPGASGNAAVSEAQAAPNEATLNDEPAQSMPAAVPPTGLSGPQNNVYVLDENLKITGRLEDLAQGERIYSVRFLGDKAYMVTFRQTDPLFVMDLSIPGSPKVLGHLKIPGVSDYLHPYDETHIIGVGRDATDEGRIRGMKLSLFDVSDVANPREISKYIIGEQGTYSDALYDHKAFLFSKEKNLLVIPVSEYHSPEMGAPEMRLWKSSYWQGAYVFNIDLASGITLKGKVTHQNETESSEYYYDYLSQIRRSIYIDNVLYTISARMIKMNALDALSEINRVELPVLEEQRLYGGAVY